MKRGPDRIGKIASRLGRHPALASLDDAARRRVAAAGRERALSRGEALFTTGEKADRLALVLSGRFVVERLGAEGEEFHLRSLGADAVVGFSLIAGRPASADVTAREAARVWTIPGAALRAELCGPAAPALAVIGHLSDLVATLTEELDELRAGDVVQRLRIRLARLASGKREIVIKHRELASNLRAERATVSRALARLERDGVLKRHRGRIEWLG